MSTKLLPFPSPDPLQETILVLWESLNLHCGPEDDLVKQALDMCAGSKIAAYNTAVLCVLGHPDPWQKTHWGQVAAYGLERGWNRQTVN